eukprot:sb/3471546/
MAGRSVTVLFEWLIQLVESKPPPVKLSGVEKRLLTSETLAICLQEDPQIYESLVNTLQHSLTKEDLGCLFATFSLAPVQKIPPNPSSDRNRKSGSSSSSSSSVDSSDEEWVEFLKSMEANGERLGLMNVEGLVRRTETGSDEEPNLVELLEFAEANQKLLGLNVEQPESDGESSVDEEEIRS